MSSTEVKLEVETDKETAETDTKEKEDVDGDPDEEAKKPLNPNPEEPQKMTSVFEVATALQRTQTFAQKLRKISVKNPPTKNPCGYFAAVFGLCCSGTVVGLGLCCCVGFFILLEVIPIVAIVVGAIFWDRARYCTAENIPLLLLIGGVLKVVHLTLFSMAGKEQSNAKKYMEKFAQRRSSEVSGVVIVEDVEANAGEGNDKEKALEDEKDEKIQEKFADEEKPKEPQTEKTESKAKPKKTSPQGTCFRLANALLTLANFTWFITASVIIYNLYSTVEYERNGANLQEYCHKGLYRFAFWYITFFYILLGLIFLVPLSICCCGCLALCCTASSD